MVDYTYMGFMYVLLTVGFIALWVWAWSSKRKPDFDEMSRLPLEDDDKKVMGQATTTQQKSERG